MDAKAPQRIRHARRRQTRRCRYAGCRSSARWRSPAIGSRGRSSERPCWTGLIRPPARAALTGAGQRAGGYGQPTVQRREQARGGQVRQVVARHPGVARRASLGVFQGWHADAEPGKGATPGLGRAGGVAGIAAPTHPEVKRMACRALAILGENRLVQQAIGHRTPPGKGVRVLCMDGGGGGACAARRRFRC